MAEIEIPNPHEVHERAENPFTRTVALFVAVYAVGLAIASFGGKDAGKEISLLKQEEAQVDNATKQEEFNTWGQYQSKSTREALYKNDREALEAEKAGTGSSFPAYKVTLLDKLIAEEKRMKADKEELAEKAKTIHEGGEKKVKGLQEQLGVYRRKDPYFDFAEVGFQLGIVLASVSMLAEKKWAFILSLILAALSAVLTVNGFMLLVAVPGIDGGGGHH